MTRRRTGSILGLVVAGFTLVSLPLIVAVTVAFVSVTSLSEQGELVADRGAKITERSQNLEGRIVALERYARQYEVVQDEELLLLYEETLARLAGDIVLLERLTATHGSFDELVVLREESRRIGEALRPDREAATDEAGEAAGEGSAAVPTEGFAVLDAAVRRWRDRSRQIIGEEAAGMQRSAQHVRRQLTWLMIVTIPLVLTMILLFTGLIGRPLRQLGRAIRRLGQSDFGDPVIVRGPADVEALGRELDVLRQRLQASEEGKRRFLRHMSHELKTPLTSLIEGAELFVDGSLGELGQSQTEVAHILRSNAQEMRHLIENLLDYSAWQETRTYLNLSDFEFQILLQQVIDQHRLALLGKNITVDQQVSASRITADREKIRTVLSNLLSNAVKYAPLSSTIHLKAYTRNGNLVLDVGDAGPNIPLAERKQVFEPFFTGAEAPPNSHVRGSGIGLSLVREYLRAHDGTIEFVDGVYRGAHLRITLPARGTVGA